VQTPEGEIYYYHAVTRAVRWEKPTGAVARAMEERIQREAAESRRRQAARQEKERAARAEQEAADEERAVLGAEADAAVREWSSGKSLAVLLSSLPTLGLVAFAGPFKPLDVDKASTDRGRLRKAYLMAARRLHPDKLPTELPLRDRLAAQKVFAVLSAKHNANKK
jgi:hypothetical protein